MGHERIGFLPKTRPWREVVNMVATVHMSEIEISDIVNQTTYNIRSKFRKIFNDEGVIASFKFLIVLSVASRSPKPVEELASYGISLPEKFSPLSLAKAFNNWFSNYDAGSLEYHQIAKSVTIDVIGMWTKQNKSQQLQLFQLEENPFEIWGNAGTGAGFCELTRLYFSKFTERYLNYFLEREASAALSNLHLREQFQKSLENHIDVISHYAFETSKITQSFAAGWFNKHAREKIPSDNEIRGFLAHAFGKIREELRREDVSK